MEEASLREIFDEFGTVTEISLPINRETGTIRGFGFITFENKDMAENAIEGLQGKEILGRNVYCNTAGKDAPKRPQQTNTRNRDGEKIPALQLRPVFYMNSLGVPLF